MPSSSAREIRVWDPVVRIGHWALVVLFFTAYFTEGELITIHSWAGYGIGAYVVIRLVWGLVGTRYARFANFWYGPRAAMRYLLDLIRFRAERHVGHSPAGAVMVYALLVGLTLSVVTGMAALAVEENAGPLAPWLGGGAVVAAVPQAAADEDDEKEGEGRREESAIVEVHEVFVNLTLLLVIAHIAGVALASLAHRENLPRAMVTGLKRAE